MYNYEDSEPLLDADSFKAIALACGEMLDLEQKVRDAEAALAEAKAAYRDISEVRLPSLMDDLDCTAFETGDGLRFEVEEKIHASITKDNNSAACDWLRNHGHDGLVKRTVSVLLGREMSWDDAKHVRSILLRETGEDASITEVVHPSTLRAFVKRELEAGSDLPLDLFSVYKQRTMKVKR